MNKFFILLLSISLLGCSSTIRSAKQVSATQESVNKQEDKIDKTYDKIIKNESDKKIQTSVLATGIQYSLNQVTNNTIEVETAKSLNERVISIVGSPHLDEVKRIKATVDLLNSAIEEERKKGEQLLLQRDKIIEKLQKEKEDLKDLYDDQLWQMSDKAKEIAKSHDEKQATIDTMGGMFGLNAVFWGIKKFFFSCLTAIIIFVVVFIILRLLSTINPIAGAIFGIFNMMGSLVLGLIKGLTPKSFELMHFAPAAQVDKYKSPLIKIVDVIQDFKEKQKDNKSKTFTLDEILKKFDADMDTHEKELVDEILIEQKWRK